MCLRPKLQPLPITLLHKFDFRGCKEWDRESEWMLRRSEYRKCPPCPQLVKALHWIWLLDAIRRQNEDHSQKAPRGLIHSLSKSPLFITKYRYSAWNSLNLQLLALWVQSYSQSPLGEWDGSLSRCKKIRRLSKLFHLSGFDRLSQVWSSKQYSSILLPHSLIMLGSETK